MSTENLNNLSLEELKKLVKDKNEEIEKLKKVKLIREYKKLQKQEEKLGQEKQQIKSKSKSIPKQKIKTFDEYLQECIKNKTIPKDTPPYFKKALERAMKEYDKGIKHEKSVFKVFAEKYVIDGKPGLTPLQFFAEKVSQLKEFLRNHRNIKVRMIMICLMEQKVIEKSKGETKLIINQDNSYFHSQTYENLESTDVKDILSKMIK